MLAVDTNVLVRYFTSDDAHQAERARRAIVENDVWISKTVLLETEWVLRRTYRFSRQQILAIFQQVLASETLFVEDRNAVQEAITLANEGLDFADALHVASSGEAEQFLTFDADLARAARTRARIPVVGI